MKKILDLLSVLRTLMEKEKISAVIVPGTDPHASEYVAEHWQERQFISGFTGSAGTVVITTKEAGLWTDSRYFLQAADQLEGTGIVLFKEGIFGTPTITEWLGTVLPQNAVVAVNASMFSVNEMNSLRNELTEKSLKLDTQHDLISQIWNDRPTLPKNKIYHFSEKYCGQSAVEKLQNVRQKMAKKHIDVTLFSALDDVAWLLNIRGCDIEYNPVAIAFVAVEQERAILFINNEKVDSETQAYLNKIGVKMADYQSINDYLKNQKADVSVGLDFGKINFSLYQSVPNACKIVNFPSPVFATKCVKNEVELAGFRTAMERDGVAMVRLLMWLEKAVPAGNETELSVIEKLHEYRVEQENFVFESFGTIAGYAAHGAIVHYSSTPESNVPLKAENFLLLDSGGQYLDGTTDITRTLPLGNVDAKQKRDYTLVLKGHIALATARFPYGTRGNQLDALARQFLWQNSLSYGHGTGHGVGHFLGDHEGPQSIRTDNNPTILEPGMVLSDEPGVYITGEYGIRHENLVAVREVETNDFGRFLEFETLTLCPFDTTAIDFSLMTQAEIDWLNDYHTTVYERLAARLSANEQKWLAKKTKAI